MKNPIESMWYPANPSSILDIGCNSGELLLKFEKKWPMARLAGVDINQDALKAAQTKVPKAEFLVASGSELPFPDNSFELATCFEVIEHVPEEFREDLFREISRVLVPGGLLVLSVPHKGLFQWLDSNNVRHNCGWLYRLLIGKGMRDKTYANRNEKVVYHEHFNQEELVRLAGNDLCLEGVRRAGLFVFPLMDWFSWPFYRLGMSNNPVRLFFQKVGEWDYSFDYGQFSYGIYCSMRNQKKPA